MHILAFSDLHRDVAAATAVLHASADADVVIGAGDFATKGHGTADTLDILAQCAVPVIVIHGNHDDPQTLRQICARSDNLHYLDGTEVKIKGRSFFGLGGEIPSRGAAQWNITATEEDAAMHLTACPQNAILITHTPPLGVADLQRNGAHEGSEAIAASLPHLAPRLLLCGHIHHAWGTSGMIGSTPVHNLGPTINWFDI